MKRILCCLGLVLLCLSCHAALGEAAEDYICVQPGDSGYDVRIVLKTAWPFCSVKGNS